MISPKGRAPPAVNHSIEWRDRATGFHSNDIESENQRIKAFARARYSQLQLSDADVHEYAYYVNVGDALPDVAPALLC